MYVLIRIQILFLASLLLHISVLSQSKISWDTTFVQGVYNPTVYGTEEVSMWLRNNDTVTITITSLSVADTSTWNNYYGAGDSIPNFTIPAGDSTIVRFRFIAKDTSQHDGILRATTASDTIYATVRARGRLPFLSFYGGTSVPTSVQPGVPDSVRLNLDPFDLDPFRPEGSDSLVLFFREGGDTNFQGWLFFNRVSSPNPNPPFDPIPLYWVAELPGNFGDISSTGYEFFIRLRIGAYVVTLPAINAESNPYKLTSILSGGIKKNDPQPIGTTAQEYRMISVPIYPDNEDPGALLANFGVSDTTWKLMTWRSGDYIDSKSPGFPGFRPGRGYWFITKVPDTLRTGPGQSTPLANFSISLVPGWNMIGTPFDFPISWTDVMNVPPNVVPYFWEGAEYSVRTTLYPWEGFFVQNEDPFANVTITVPPRQAVGASTRSSFSFAKPLDVGEWRIQLRAASGWMKDNFNFIGALFSAQNEMDATDIYDAPRHPGDEYLQLRSLTPGGKALAFDFRSPGQNQTWNLEVAVKSAEGVVQLYFAGLQDLPVDVAVYLFDRETGLALNLRNTPSYAISVPKNTSVRRAFSIATGSVDYVRAEAGELSLIPDRFDLAGNYPNPFNPVTTLRFDLPVASRVRLTIYNSLGQIVTHLIDRTLPEGTHTILWNGNHRSGKALSSGVYFARLDAQTASGTRFSKTTKMLLVK